MRAVLKASAESDAGQGHCSAGAWKLIAPRWGVLFLALGLMAINRLAGLVLPASPRYLLDDIIDKHQADLLFPMILAIALATTTQALCSYWLTQLLAKSAQRQTANLRARVQAHIVRLSISYHDENKTGPLVSRIMNDVEGVRNLVGGGLIDFLGGILTATFACIYLIRMSVSITATVVTALGVFAFGMFYGFKTIRPIFDAKAQIDGEVMGRLTESLNGVRTVKGYQAERHQEAIFKADAERLLENALQTLRATSLLAFSATAFIGILTTLIIYMGARRIEGGQMTPGNFFSYIAFATFLMAPVAQVMALGPQVTEAMTALKRTHQVLKEPLEDTDIRRTILLEQIRGHIVFENVNFCYRGRKQVLFDVSFEAPPDTVTALVGPSGAGKSTVVALVSSFYAPCSGRVLIDGADLSAVRLNSYRLQLGVVLQDTFLFEGTIRENVSFARPRASEAEILAACRVAGVDNFADKFRDKYDTLVGERGVKLSGGQKQRVSIARAILADPRILILDEATSSLDSESEARIEEALRYLMRGRSTFVIAHRLSTIHRADQILVLEGGRIVERGTHDSLCQQQRRYYELYRRQQPVD